jgi:hypothetical protein
MSLSFTIGRSTITVFLDGQIHTVDQSHVNHSVLLSELRKDSEDRDLNTIRPLVSIRRYIEATSFGDVTIDGDAVSYKGEVITGYLATRMLEILQQGVGIEPWALFMGNLMKNPSEAARNELYRWLEHAKMPITPDGHFIAFKKVRKDYTDCHTGMFDHSVGNIIEMDRGLCNPDRHKHCSTGFHFCSVSYLVRFRGERVLAMKINPRDVTAIPADDTAKGRTCRYESVAELQNQNAADHGAWSKKAVVDLEDPAEFPELLIKPSQPAEKKKITSDGHKPVKVAKSKSSKTTKVKLGKAAQKIADGLDDAIKFITTTGKEYASAKVVEISQKYPSTREAARQMGIGESTLRGWKKKLGL